MTGPKPRYRTRVYTSLAVENGKIAAKLCQRLRIGNAAIGTERKVGLVQAEYKDSARDAQ